jgi:hypothetical protein
MDLLIRQNRRRGLITSIYDKRLEAKYANINVIRYPDTQSVMATKAKYGIVTSQLYRFLRRCTLATDFVYNISLVLHRLLNKGYFILRHPHIYAGKSVRTCATGSGQRLSTSVLDTANLAPLVKS